LEKCNSTLPPALTVYGLADAFQLFQQSFGSKWGWMLGPPNIFLLPLEVWMTYGGGSGPFIEQSAGAFPRMYKGYSFLKEW